MITPCEPSALRTTLILGIEATEEDVMTNWTDEAMKAEAAYRREQLHRMVGTRRAAGFGTSTKRDGVLHRLLPRRHRD